MPRGNFNEASKGGLGFVEGYVLIQRSTSKVYQYPMNSTTGEQSDAFPALVWEGIKLSPEWKPLPGDDNTFEIINRMGTLDTIRPGKLDPKDFDNMDKEPADLGTEVGAEGNAFYMDAGAKFSMGWGIMKESLEKCAFKPEILGHGVASDFEGMMAHFKTVEGQPYIGKRGKNQGKEVKPTNLVCDRIQPPYPYEIKDKSKLGKPVAHKGAGGASGASGTSSSAGASGAAPAGGGSPDAGEIASEVGALFGDFSDKFKAEVPIGTTVKRAVFQKALTMELLRRKMRPDVQKQIMDFVKSDQLAELGAGTDLFKVEGDSITLS